MLFISLPCAFFMDLNIPPVVNPPEIIFISLAGGLSSLTFRVLSWSSFRWYLYGSVFLMYFCNFPCQIKVSTWTFKCLHSSVRCPWSWWNLQYLFLSLLSTGVLIGFSHCREGYSFICIRTCSIDIIRGVKLVDLAFLSRSSFFFPLVCPPLHISFFLSRLLFVPSSLFLFPFISFASIASSAFMYFWAWTWNPSKRIETQHHNWSGLHNNTAPPPTQHTYQHRTPKKT